MPAYRYRDPAEVTERDEVSFLRRNRGCSVCKGRADQNAWGQVVCAVGKAPDKGRTHCQHWRLDEGRV